MVIRAQVGRRGALAGHDALDIHGHTDTECGGVACYHFFNQFVGYRDNRIVAVSQDSDTGAGL